MTACSAEKGFTLYGQTLSTGRVLFKKIPIQGTQVDGNNKNP